MDVQRVREILYRVPFFRELDEQEWNKIHDIAFRKSFACRTLIFRQGEPREAVYFICKGTVKIYKLDRDGNEQIINLLTAGDMFPHVGFFDGAPYPATAEVLEPAELLVIPIKAFEQALLETPTIAIKVMRVMGQKLLDLQAKLLELTMHDVHQRLISILLRLTAKHGKQEGGTIELTLPLTHQELANMAGTTRETVNRLLNQLKKEGILQIDRKKITLLQPDALRRRAPG